ncbi:MAG: hypothetical protein LUD29_06615 [Clostridia bacterium]|nr:hypothetical protein [Clostridia bacterium]
MGRKGYRIVNTKFIRRTLIIVFVLVFLVASVIVTGFMTAVKNVNVYVPYYTGAGETDEVFGELSADDEVYAAATKYEADFNATCKNLDGLKNSNLIFLREKKISQCVTLPSRIRVASYEKDYPATLTVTLEKRIETFTSYDVESGVRCIYDSCGELMERKPGDASVLDDDGRHDVVTRADASDADMRSMAYALEVFCRELCCGKEFFERMDVADGALYVRLSPGAEIEIAAFCDDTDAKIQSASALFMSLDEWDMVRGKIMTYETGLSVYEG